jgi:two-component system response regulator AtoC
MAMPTRILIVEPDQRARESLQLLLPEDEYEVVCAADAELARALLDGGCFDLIVSEGSVPMEGGDSTFVRWCLRALPAVTVITTSDPNHEAASEQALLSGAYDHLHKPFDAPASLLAIRRAAERQRMRRSAELLRRELQQAAGNRPVVAASTPMIELLELIERATSFEAPVLLLGETGAGKEGLARVIHAQSPRRHRPFVAVQCSSAPEDELESALFGRAGSETYGVDPPEPGLFLDADGGTLYFDEISALSTNLQLQLLRALQDEQIQPVGGVKTRPIDVRIIASTSDDLQASVSAGEFSDELLQRLSAVQIRVPPLRERKEDIPLLVDSCLARTCAELRKPLRAVADQALETLVNYAWPGNVRELQSVVERAVLLARGNRIARDDLPESVLSPRLERPGEAAPDLGLRRARKRLEADLIRRALWATGGNRTHAARLLEISHRALLYKIKEYGIGT